ncbi:MAG: hypothetical protein Q7K03_02600 [Dehalococcoidia bacterium]|nr:hypothetical protein [Dehalococcoidia bacterium]
MKTFALISGVGGLGLQILLQMWQSRHPQMDDRLYWGLLALGAGLMLFAASYGLSKTALGRLRVVLKPASGATDAGLLRPDSVADVASRVVVKTDRDGSYALLKVRNAGQFDQFEAKARFVGPPSIAARHKTDWSVHWRGSYAQAIGIKRDADEWLDIVAKDRHNWTRSTPILRFHTAKLSTGLVNGEPSYSDHFDLKEKENEVQIEVRILSVQDGQVWSGEFDAVMCDTGVILAPKP